MPSSPHHRIRVRESSSARGPTRSVTWRGPRVRERRGVVMTVAVASSKPIHHTHRVEADGAVDADGHILEPPDLWESYIDPKFRDRALRFKLDERGLEELEIDGRRSTMSRRGFPATLGAMGAPDLPDMMKNPDRTYLGES